MKFVIYPAVDDARLARIAEVAVGVRVVNAANEESALREIVDANAFFGKLSPELLARATKLRWVQAPTASLEHYLFPVLIDHPCQLTNMRGLYSDVIADHVMAYVLCFARNLHLYLRQQTQRIWEPIGGEEARSNFVSGPGQTSTIDAAHMHLADATLGVVGVGQIGSEIARRAAAFGMSVLGVDPVRRELPGMLPEIWPLARLGDLLAQSDFVVIAAPHTPQTEKLFRFAQLQQMKRSGILINIGRGAIVDLGDLVRALEERVIAGAALDVYEVEPLPVESPLWRMDNVILTPHVAGVSPRIAERHTATLLENLRRFLAGESLLTPVDKSQWF
jgi:phosphoglycerate dehydrogenase-like enzyme